MSSTRQCPFYGCSKMIDASIFACRHHWPAMPDDDRFEIWRLYTAYQKGEIRLEQLVEAQANIMLKNTPQIVPGSPKGPSHDEAELAKLVEQYIRLRKEYTATKDGYVDAKKRIGMELSKKEAALAKACKDILHPTQVQPTLFDAGDKKAGLPD